MGLLANSRLISRLARPDAAVPFEAVGGSSPRLVMPGNPFQTGALNELVWYDLFAGVGGISREQALSIPGVARGRGILLSLICDKPLVDFIGGDRAAEQPKWLYRVPGWQGPWQRMARTVDDHIFYGEALWGCKRGAASSGLKPILDAWHVPYEMWEVDAFGRICVVDEDGQMVPVDEDEVIYLPSAHDGLLSYATRTLRGSVELEQAWVSRAKNPIPALDLHETNDTGMERDERQLVVDDWAKARSDPNGAIASTPYNIEARVLGSLDPQMFIEARNASRLDVANFFQIPASAMDATTATASLTYVTQESGQNSIDSMTIPYWVRPLEDRLSQDDVLPIGHITRFAWAEALTEPPGPIKTTRGGPVIDAAAAPVGEALGEALAENIEERT